MDHKTHGSDNTVRESLTRSFFLGQRKNNNLAFHLLLGQHLQKIQQKQLA